MLASLLLLALLVQPPAGEEKVKEPELRQELLARYKKDQNARFAYVNFMAKHKIQGADPAKKLDPEVQKELDQLSKTMHDTDKDDLVWMKQVVEKHGWPGASLIGKAGADAAWLLVQHADTDRDFQALCLKKMETLPSGEVEPRHIAYLTDRILVGRGKKQRFGTQGKWEQGKLVASPIEDPEHVDERRKSVGLEPLAEYFKQMEKAYSQPQKPNFKKP
jgi:hypothetical protein